MGPLVVCRRYHTFSFTTLLSSAGDALQLIRPARMISVQLRFDNMKPPKNCIEKDAVFSVSHSRNLGTVFTTYEGRYKLQENGGIVDYKSTFEAR